MPGGYVVALVLLIIVAAVVVVTLRWDARAGERDQSAEDGRGRGVSHRRRRGLRSMRWRRGDKGTSGDLAAPSTTSEGAAATTSAAGETERDDDGGDAETGGVPDR